MGLPGLKVLDVEEADAEVVVRVESTRAKAYCPSCRHRAEAKDRVEVHVRDQHCFGRSARLVINKRRWRCGTDGCVRRTWTERIEGIAPRQVLTVRAGAEVCRQAGQLCRSVVSVADEYGVGWDTAWAAVRLHGTPLVEHRRRVGRVRALGVDEHAWLAATPDHRTLYATALVDLDRRQVIDLLEWVSRSEDVVVAGPSGTGKSHLLEAIGQRAVEEGLSVAWFSVEGLGTIVRRHRVDDTASKAFATLAGVSLTVIDDIGLLPISADAAEGLYRLVDAAYERRSLAL